MRIENIGWSIGNFCNAKCSHCYSWKQRQGHEILSLDEINTILDKIISYGVKTVNFGGNEPIFTNGIDLEHTMLPYIIERLYENNVICGITTNGFTAKYLFENYFDTFMKINDWDFSLDAPYSEEHNKNRNVSNAFEMVLEGLDICTKYNRAKSIVVVGMCSNLIPEVLEQFILLAREYNADFRINILKPTEKHHAELLPSVDNVYESIDYLLEKMDVVCLSESVFASQVGIECNGCPCGENSFRIRNKVNGRVPVTPCVYLDLDAGDILTESIGSIVAGTVFSHFRQRKKAIPTQCHDMNCRYLESCRGGCTARTLLMKGAYDEPDPYCPYLLDDCVSEKLQNKHVVKCNTDNVVRVHENYLCTWIGSIKNVES